MNGRCDDALVQMYVDGTLVPAERAVVAAHLSVCVKCRRSANAYKVLHWDLEHPELEPVPAKLQAVSNHLMAAWDEAQAAKAPAAKVRERSPAPERAPTRTRLPGWASAGLMWTRTSAVAPVVAGLGAGAASATGALARVGAGGLRWLLRRGGGRR